MGPPLVIVDAELPGGRRGEVRVEDGLIVDLVPRVSRRPGDAVVAGAGGALLPGLHDHHIHLRAWAAAEASVAVGPPQVRDPTHLGRVLRAAASGGVAAGVAGGQGAWVRAVGYHETVAGPLDAAALDALVSARPVRVQHRSGELWILNSAAVAATGLAHADHPGVERDPAGRPTGRLWRMDRWLADRVPPVAADVGALGRRAAAAGVTGFTDATPDRRHGEAEELAALVPQRLYAMAPASGSRRHPPGPVKVILDDTSLPPVGDLVALACAAHSEGRAVAVHCVTAVQLAVTLAAFQEAGPPPPGVNDRVEHGAVVNPDHRRLLRRLGVTVVTQPAMAAARGDDYLREVNPDERSSLWPLASLLASGVRLAAGTDAPFGPPDPWAAVASAVRRITPGRAVLGAGERLAPWAALRLFLGHAARPWHPRRVVVGATADLCLLAAPLGNALGDAARGLAPRVRTTIRGGDIIHGQGSDAGCRS